MLCNCLGQNNELPYLYLTNYSITNQTNSIGYVKLNGAEIKSVTVWLANMLPHLRSVKTIELSVRPDKLKSGTEWFDITLTVKTSNGKLSKAFRIVKDEFIRNKVIAHRGAWKNTGAPENSIAALKHA